MDENLLNRIIAAAYGDSSFIEKLRIKRIIRSNPQAAKLYEQFSMVSRRVHSLPGEKCPDIVVGKAREMVQAGEVQRPFIYRTAIAFTVLIIAAAAALFSLRETGQKTYTAQEVKAAEYQAKESLALVGRILNRTTNTLGNEILPEKVSKPVKKGITIINNLLSGG